MSFLQPWWLLLGLLAVPILAFHLRRRRRLIVPSTFVWERVLGESVIRASRRAPIANLLLALQLLLLALLVLALARPQVGVVAADHWVVVVDTSGSMQATDVAPNRLEAARKYLDAELSRRLGAGGGPRHVSIVAVGAEPKVLGARLSSLASARAATAALRPVATAPDWSRLGSVLKGLVRPGERVTVTLLTDPQDADAAQAAAKDGLPDVSAERVTFAGRHPVNLGITDLSATLGASGAWHVSGSVRRYTGEATTVQVEVLFERQGSAGAVPWTSLDVPLDEGGGGTFRTDLKLPAPGALEVRLPSDDLASDNRAYRILRAGPRQVRVLEVGPGNGALERALTSIDGVKLYRSSALPPDASSYGLVVVDGVRLDRRPGTSTWWVDVPPPGVDFGAALQAPRATSWSSDHPLSRTVDWPSITLARADTAPQLPGADVLLASGGHPLVQARTLPDGREVLTAFALKDGDWETLTSFPAFVYDLVRWVAPDLGSQSAPPCSAGAPCSLDYAKLAGGAALTDPAGKAVELPDPWLGSTGQGQGASPRWLAPWADTLFRPHQPGIYRLGSGAASELLAVDAYGGGFSDLEPAGGGAHRGSGAGLATWKVLLVLALAALLAEAWLSGGTPFPGRSRVRARRWTRWVWRAVAVALVALALVDPPLPWPQRSQQAVLVSDDGTLYGTAGGDAIRRFRRDAARKARGEGQLGVVDLAGRPSVAADLGAGGNRDAMPTASEWPGARLGDALSMAAAMLSRTQTGRLAVVSSGAATGDGLAGALTTLHARRIPVDVLSVSDARAGDASVERVEAPVDVYPSVPFTIHGLVRSTVDQPAEMRVLVDGQVKVDRQVRLAQGSNDLTAQLTADTSGPHQVTIDVRAAQDGFTANDHEGVALDVRSAPNVAVITEQPARAKVLADALGQQGVAVTVLSPTNAPWDLKGWLAYDAAILMDVPAIDLHSTQQAVLERWVRDDGGGLLILGGANAYGPGGYFNTPLERLSPLSSKIPRQAPQVAILFVLDRSGSMQQSVGDVSRLAIAKSATLDALKLLNPQSLTGVVVFDTKANVVVPLQPVSGLSQVQARLGGVQAAGGTALYPALVDAYQQLQSVTSMTKHIVVMSDGLSQPADFPGILDKMQATGITVSAVAISDEADKGFLQHIAALGKGAFHSATDVKALPSILAQEALLLSASPVKNEPIQPSWQDRSATFLKDLPGQVPALGGYVETSAKPQANVALAGPDGTPLLASWRYGVGRVVAFASQGAGPWTATWLQTPAYAKLWSQAVRWALSVAPRPGLNLSVRRQGDQAYVDVEAVAPDGTPASGLALSATVLTPGNEQRSLRLREAVPGSYRTSFPIDNQGTYQVAVRPPSVAAGGADTWTAVSADLYAAYPARYRTDAPDAERLRTLAAVTGGRVLQGTEPVFPETAPWRLPARRRPQVWLVLALAMFLAELAMRYVSLRSWWRAANTALRGPLQRPPERTAEHGGAGGS